MSRPNTPSMEGAESFEEITKEVGLNNTKELSLLGLTHRQSYHANDDYPESSEYESISPENPAKSYRQTRDRTGMQNVNDFRASTTETSSMTSTQEMMDELLGDVNAMIESAGSIVKTARQIRNIVHQSVECVDLQRPGVSQLGLIGTIKDLRRETVRAVVDADRAHLRFAKVLAEFSQLRRCLRRLGVIPSPGTYGVRYNHAGIRNHGVHDLEDRGF